jgi:chromosome segregation ATPase
MKKYTNDELIEMEQTNEMLDVLNREDIANLIQEILDLRALVDSAGKTMADLNNAILPLEDEINRLRLEVNTLESKLASETMYREIFQKRDAVITDGYDEINKEANQSRVDLAKLRQHVRDMEQMVLGERALALQAGEKEGKLFVENMKLKSELAAMTKRMAELT